MRSLWRQLSLSAFLLLGLSYQVRAETLSFEGLSQIPLSSEQDHDVGEMLAMIESQNRALEQALAYLRKQPFFATTRLQADYFPALALSLINDSLAFAPKANAGQRPMAQYKFKLRYDSMRFPDKVDTFFQQNFYGVALVKRALENTRRLEAESRSYLQKVSQAQDPAYLQMLRDSEGRRLQQQFRIYQISLEANTYYSRKQYAKALELLDEAIRIDPANPDLYMFRGLITAEDKKYDTSLKDLSRAIELAPEEATFYLMRGSVYLAQAILIGKSRQDFNRSIELKPDIGLAYLLRAYTNQALKDCPAALADYKKACDLGMSDACERGCSSF